MNRWPLGACLLVSACLPYVDYSKRYYDNRADDRVELVCVTPEGLLELSDGRTVRLFGVRIPEDPAPFIQSVTSWLAESDGFEVHEMLPGAVPAVRVGVYRKMFACGTCEAFRSVSEGYRSGLYSIEPHVVNKFRSGVFEPLEDDLVDPRAPEGAVKDLRDALKQRGR